MCNDMRVTMLLILSLLFANASLSGLQAQPVRVLMLGDSITAGFGLDRADSLPVRLEAWLRDQGHDIAVINAGVSGDTTTGGRARLAWVLDGQPQQPNLVIIALGGNDILRSVPIEVTRENMQAMADTITTRDLPLMIAGMTAPPDFGPEYERQLTAIYRDTALKHNAALYPGLLDGVADESGFKADLHQNDGIHPNATGVLVIVERLGPAVLAALGLDALAKKSTNPTN